MNLPQYRNFPFGAGNARNSWFWGAVLVFILLFLIMVAKKRSGYDIKTMVDDTKKKLKM